MLEWYVGSIGSMAINDDAGCEMAERFELSIAWRRLAG